MANREPEGGSIDRRGRNGHRDRNDGGLDSAQQECVLSSSDHSILEKAIRDRVAGLVGSSHPEWASKSERPIESSDKREAVLGSLDEPSDPDVDSFATNMPGREKAIGYRKLFASALIDSDPRSHRALLEELCASGIPIQTLAIHIFSPVAARLGELWCEDEADFMQVAVATSRLQMIVNHISLSASDRTNHYQARERRLLLARTRGAQHTVGVSIVAACFRDMGWIVDGGGDLEVDDGLLTRLKSTHYDLLGLSVGLVEEARVCSEIVRKIHADRRMHRTRIAVGGPAVAAAPHAFAKIGADIIARNSLEAIRMVDRMVS